MVYLGLPSAACFICRTKRVKVSHEHCTATANISGVSIRVLRPDANSVTLESQHVGDASRTILRVNTEADWT